jgi:GTPase SAR1 family protein
MPVLFSGCAGETVKSDEQPCYSTEEKRLPEKLAETFSAPLPKPTPRQVHGVVSLPNKATAVVGKRRAGKTTFLHQLPRERLDQGVARERLVYLNFEDEQLAGLQAAHLNSLLEESYRWFPACRRKERVSFILDEIQQVPDWERFGGLGFTPLHSVEDAGDIAHEGNLTETTPKSIPEDRRKDHSRKA